MTDRFYVLGVDPGRRSGAGLVRCMLPSGNPRNIITHPVTACIGHWQHTRAKISPEAWAESVIREARALATSDDPSPDPLRSYLVHEAQFIGEAGGKAAGTLKTAIIAGVWRGLGAHYGFAALDDAGRYGVHPQTWRAELDDRPHGARKPRKAEAWEQWAVAKVRAHGIPCLKTHHHKAEAILIAVWGARRLAKAKEGAS